MRVLVGMFSHETNTFSNLPASREMFEARTIRYGEEILSHYAGTEAPLGAFIRAAEEEGVSLTGSIAATASPSGRVTRDMFEHALHHVLAGCDDGPDGILLALHGAMAVEGMDDGEGELLRRIRNKVGPGIPVVATLDFHANLSPAMVEHSTALVGYTTYPHVDIYDRARNAARILFATSRKQRHPTASFFHLPLLTPALAQGTDRDPMRGLRKAAIEAEKQPGVLSVSLLPGFPYADVPDAGFGITVVTENDPELAKDHGKRLANLVWELRSRFTHSAIPVNEAVTQAMKAREYPVLLADVSDNTGAGGAGDNTALLAELMDRGAQNVVIATLWDVQAVEASLQAGIGRDVSLTLGGKQDSRYGGPVHLVARVRRISDGHYLHKGPMFRGMPGALGRSVLLDANGILMIVHEKRVQALEPDILWSMGVNPADQEIIVLKSSLHYRAAFEPMVKQIIEVDSLGLASPDLCRFSFQHLRRPIYPLDREMMGRGQPTIHFGD